MADFVIIHNLHIDFPMRLCYADYVGGVIGTSSFFVYFDMKFDIIVKFHMVYL